MKLLVMLLRPYMRSWLFPLLAIVAFVTAYFYPLHADIGAPYWDTPDGGDAILQGLFVKTILETGWVSFNPNLGAPFGADLLDFPGADGFFLCLIKALSLITSDPATIMNLFYILSYVLVFFCSYWVFRRFSFDFLWATVGALIFA